MVQVLAGMGVKGVGIVSVLFVMGLIIKLTKVNNMLGDIGLAAAIVIAATYGVLGTYGILKQYL